MRPVRRLLGAIAGAAVAMAVLQARPAIAASPAVTVCPSCAVTTIQEGLDRLAAGGTLTVKKGHYSGPVTIDRPATMVGSGHPVIDGGGRGTVVRVTAGQSTVKGFIIRGSGTSLDREDAGVAVRAAKVSILGNRIDHVLFGVYAKAADGLRISGNTVVGLDLPLAQKGDGLRVWNSEDSRVTSNTVRGVRDNMLWFGERCTFSDNTVTDSRYGIHLMWSNNCTLSRNNASDNVVGGYMMYSVGLRITDNTFTGNRDSTGFGLGLRDADSIEASRNVILHNRTGLALFNSPRGLEAKNTYSRNVLGYNDVGVSMEAAGRGNSFSGNDFIDNITQVTAGTQASSGRAVWATHGRGNYWSDYSGYDTDGDGVGDIVHAPKKSFESLIGANPDFALFSYSPVAEALNWASEAFPVLNSEVPVRDPAPLTRPAAAPASHQSTGVSPGLLIGGAVLVLAGIIIVVALRHRGAAAGRRDDEDDGTVAGDAAPVVVEGMGKSYGDAVILTDLSFTVQPGEVLGLWGDNGAGKTTVLRCLLGQVRHTGEVWIGGYSARTQPRRVRAALGHVSQEPAFHGDLSVAGTIEFYGRLRGADADDQALAISRVGLDAERNKRVAALSGGMRRKLAIAVALLGDPAVILLDEPTANLDQASRQDLLALLHQLKKSGIAMLLASHQPDEIVALADRILHVTAGKPAEEVDIASVSGTAAIDVPQHSVDQAVRVLLEAGIPTAMSGPEEQR